MAQGNTNGVPNETQTHEDLLVKLANHHTTQGAQNGWGETHLPTAGLKLMNALSDS